jgi:hypothetical protein
MVTAEAVLITSSHFDTKYTSYSTWLNAAVMILHVNLLKICFPLNIIYKPSPYLTGSTPHLRYRAQPVNAVWGNSRCLL